jgi:ketosteroid isomerase-like protein
MSLSLDKFNMHPPDQYQHDGHPWAAWWLRWHIPIKWTLWGELPAIHGTAPACPPHARQRATIAPATCEEASVSRAELDRETLRRLTLDFTRAFNENDLDAVMSHFAEDALYDPFNDEPARGADAIRAAFEPQFKGAFGRMQFLEEDLFVDAGARKTLVSWTCTLETNDGPAGWRGLDILHFDARGKITQKLTYAKAKVPLLRPR